MDWILVCVALLTLFYFCVIRRFNYWTRRGIPQKSIAAQLVNTARLIFQLKSVPDMFRDLYNEFPRERCSGGYQFLSPVLYVRDLDLIKQVTIKDFDHFVDHMQFIPEDVEPLLGRSLFGLKGDTWREMRATLSPSFTSSKMKAMFTMINDCARPFINHFKNGVSDRAVDMKDAFTRFANDVITSTAFGISCDSLKEPDNEFYLTAKEVTTMRGFWRNLKMLAILFAPRLCKMLGIRIVSSRANDFYRRIVKTNMEEREKNGIVRPDMIHQLMEARTGRLKHDDQTDVLDTGFAVIEESSVGKETTRRKQQFTDDDLTAQALIFYFAGFEAVSTMMCFMVYEIAVNRDVQEKLRDEVDQVLSDCDNSLTYENLLRMKYMDMVVSETLRKWPIQLGVDRVCVKPYTIQPSSHEEKPIRVERGEILWLPIYGIHRNPDFYPDPERFEPERFSDENKGNVNPYAYIPFGIGPRSCIGNRFALLEAKIILFHVLAHFEIKPTDETTVPLKLSKNQFGLYSDNGFWFRLKPRGA